MSVVNSVDDTYLNIMGKFKSKPKETVPNYEGEGSN